MNSNKYVALNIPSLQSTAKSRRSLWRVRRKFQQLVDGLTRLIILFFQWWNQLSRFQRTLSYVLFASTLLVIIYLWPALQQSEDPIAISVQSVPSPEPVESVLKAAEETAVEAKVDEQQQPADAEYEAEAEIKQPVQQVEEPLTPTAVIFSGIKITSSIDYIFLSHVMDQTFYYYLFNRQFSPSFIYFPSTVLTLKSY